MKEEQFIKANSGTWKELEQLSSKVDKIGFKALPSKEVKRFLYIFRHSSHHLAYARTYYPNSSVVEYLNSLIGKSHSYVYAVKKFSFSSLWKYVSYDFPKYLKDYKWYIAASFGSFAFGMLLSLALVIINTDYAYLFMDGSIVDAVKSGHVGGSTQWNHPLQAASIMTNNISVSLRAFAFGITLGIGTIYVLYANGALLGSLTALIYLYDRPVQYWSLILPHGVIELTAIFISGGAGLLIAKGLILPGELSRKHALVDGAKKAASLVGGIIILLIIAGIIEGFYTPLEISPISKLIFAAVTALILTGYFSIPYFTKRSKPTKY